MQIEERMIKMALIETWIKTDLKSIISVKYIRGNLFSQDNMANLIGVELLENGEPANVSGTVSANVLRADGATVAVSGTLSGNMASVTLPQAAYAVPGMLSVAVKLTSGSTITTIGAIQAIVYRTSSDTIVDPGTIIPSVEELINRIDAAVASIPPDYSALSNQVSTNTTDISGLKTATSDLPTMRTNIAANTEDVSSLKSAISTKAPVIIGSASGSIATFSDGADDMPVKDLTVQIDPVQAGSGDPSPDNVRPITGWTGVRVTRMGKNLLPKLQTGTVSSITSTENSDGSFSISGSSTYNNASFDFFRNLANLPTGIEAGNSYIYSLGSNINRFDIYTSSNGTSFDNQLVSVSTVSTGTFTVPSNAVGMLVRLFLTAGVNYNQVIYPMIRLASETDPTFAPYQSETYDITFPTEAGTVYGGTLTVEKDGSGVLVVDRASVSITGSMIESVSSASTTDTDGGKRINTTFKNAVAVTDTSVLPSVIQSDRLCVKTGNIYSEVTPNRISINDIGQIVLRYAGTATLSAAQTALNANPVQAVYKLATPTTYTLTTEQIKTLLGNNNIGADTGNVSVEYPADTKLYIDGKIAELQALVLENISNS